MAKPATILGAALAALTLAAAAPCAAQEPPVARSRGAVEALRADLDDPAKAAGAAAALRRVLGGDFAPDDLAAARAGADELLRLPADLAEARLRRAADAEADRLRTDLDAAADALDRLARARFADAPAESRDALLLSYLAADAPALRRTGLGLVLDATTFGGMGVTDAVAVAVRERIADPSPAVRETAARTVAARGDKAALGPLLDQLPRETDPAARLAQVEALRPLGDAAAAGALLDFAAAGSPSLRRRAARVAAELAEASGDAGLRGRVADRLTRAYAAAGDEARRADLLSAVAALRDPRLTRFYFEILRQPRQSRRGDGGQSAEVRAAALDGVATLRAAELADAAVPNLSDPDARVRAAAVAAVAATGGFGRARQVARFFDPAAEPDPTVRRAAWRAFAALIPDADDRQLAAWPDRLTDPRRKLVVLRALADRAEARGDAAALAERRYQVADVLATDPATAAEAGGLYELALEHALSSNGPPVVVVTRVRAALGAYVRAGLVGEVTRLATRVMADRPATRQDVGSAVKREAERLVESGDAATAAALLDAALAWDPPLDPTSLRNLRDLRAAIGR